MKQTFREWNNKCKEMGNSNHNMPCTMFTLCFANRQTVMAQDSMKILLRPIYEETNSGVQEDRIRGKYRKHRMYV